MKGFTHFMSGVAAATCVPEIVRMSTASRLDTVEGAASSLIILLPGIFGILPDTMDFKLGQFFSPGDVIVDPDPINTDPQKMAESFAEAVRR
ncbi:TPA: archaeal/vacuolar-type H+-ATPase subunit I, partial [bacterium]|nr:archaeal/vacuolar-type H+-ATPase subunit I [bacterium]